VITNNQWFEVDRVQKNLYVIRERLDLIEPRYLTRYTNIYLLLGDHTAVLVDTGTGVANLSGLVRSLIDDRELLVINSHNHFDHIGSNYQFDVTHIHRRDFKKLMKPLQLDFLRGCTSRFSDHFARLDWSMKFAPEMVPLTGDEIFNLGGLNLEVIYTPGHTPGSISLLSSSGDLFTGDSLHYGPVYLPGKDWLFYYNSSLQKLGKIIAEANPVIYPGHHEYGVGSELYQDFMLYYEHLEELPVHRNDFLSAQIYTTDAFTFVKPLPGLD